MADQQHHDELPAEPVPDLPDLTARALRLVAERMSSCEHDEAIAPDVVGLESAVNAWRALDVAARTAGEAETVARLRELLEATRTESLELREVARDVVDQAAAVALRGGLEGDAYSELRQAVENLGGLSR